MIKLAYAAALMATLFWCSSQQFAGPPGPLDIPDKWAHLLVFGLLATLYLRHPWFENKGRQGVWMAIIAAIMEHLMNIINISCLDACATG